MTAEEALQIVERILPPGTMTSVQATIFRRCWLDEDYAAIAKDLGYGYGYIRDAGAQLWRALSGVLHEPVKKKNFRALFQQRFNQRQFSFNSVALPLELPEFNAAHIQWLAQRYELNWSLTEAQQLMVWVGGHPYLVQLALYHLWTKTVTLDDIVQFTPAAIRVYAPYLQGILAILQSNLALSEVFRQILMASYSLYCNPLLISQLENLGLIKIEQGIPQVRCQLYQYYFSNQLSAIA